MQWRRFRGAKHVLLGNGVVQRVLPERLAGKRVLLVTDKHLTSHIHDFRRAFPTARVFDEVVGEPDSRMVRRIQQASGGCDCIVALGGGSPLDAAKAARACNDDGSMAEPASIWKPLIAIPTTSGTGSEVTPFSVIANTTTKEKRLLAGPTLVPTLSLVDPTLTYGKPAWLTAVTGMDALCHALEAFLSRKSNPYSDAFAVRALRRIGTHLPQCVRNPCPTSRYEMMVGSTEAGLAFSSSSVTLVHGMSRPLGRFGIGHGMANAQLVSEVVAFSQRMASDTTRFEVAKSLLFPHLDSSVSLSNALSLLAQEELRIPTLRETLVQRGNVEEYESRIARMGREAMRSGSPLNNPVVPTHEQIEDLYRRAAR